MMNCHTNQRGELDHHPLAMISSYLMQCSIKWVQLYRRRRQYIKEDQDDQEDQEDQADLEDQEEQENQEI